MSEQHHGDTPVSSDLSSLSLTSAGKGGQVVEDNRIKVVCRVRPPVSRETHGAKGLANRCVQVAEDQCTVTLNSKPQGKSFTFDYAAGETSTQEELFAEVDMPEKFQVSEIDSRRCLLIFHLYRQDTAAHTCGSIFIVIFGAAIERWRGGAQRQRWYYFRKHAQSSTRQRKGTLIGLCHALSAFVARL